MLSLPSGVTCGYFDCSEFGSLSVSPPRTAAKYEIELYLEDGLQTMTDEVTCPVLQQYIHITRPGQTRHSLLPFYTAYVKFEATGDISARLDAAPAYFYSRHAAVIQRQIDEMILLCDAGNELRLHSVLLALLDLVLSDAAAPAAVNSAQDAVIAQAKRFIEANAHTAIRLRDIAACVHLSESYFHSIFTAATGRSPHRYLTECRVENAKRLLWNSNYSMEDIAEKTGFCNQQYFGRIFKTITGYPPNQYRRLFQQNYLLP